MEPSMYVNVPRPFNRFPPGYRPVEPPLHRFSSLSNLSSTGASPVNGPVFSTTMRRAGSMMMPLGSPEYSPLSSPPLSFSPPSFGGPLGGRDPWAQRSTFSPSYDNVPALLQQQQPPPPQSQQQYPQVQQPQQDQFRTAHMQQHPQLHNQPQQEQHAPHAQPQQHQHYPQMQYQQPHEQFAPPHMQQQQQYYPPSGHQQSVPQPPALAHHHQQQQQLQHAGPPMPQHGYHSLPTRQVPISVPQPPSIPPPQPPPPRPPPPSSSRPLQHAQRPDDFLESIRQQREEVERSIPIMHRPIPVAPPTNDRKAETLPRALHKTQSDSSLFQEPLFFGRPRAPWRNDAREEGYGADGGGLLHQAVANESSAWRNDNSERHIPIQVQLDNDRVLKIPFQPNFPDIPDRFSNQVNGSGDRFAQPPRHSALFAGESHPLQGVDTSQRIPVQIRGNNRPASHYDQRAFSPDTSGFNRFGGSNTYGHNTGTNGFDHHNTSQQQHDHGFKNGHYPQQHEARLTSPPPHTAALYYNGGPLQPLQNPPDSPSDRYERIDADRYDRFDRGFSPPGRAWSPPRQEARQSYAPPPPPPPPPAQQQQPGSNGRTSRFDRQTTPPMERRRDRSVTPSRQRPAHVPQALHDELLSVIPRAVGRREQQGHHVQPPDDDRDNPFMRAPVELCRPVGSKIKEAVRVNGFAEPAPSSAVDQMSASYPSYDNSSLFGSPPESQNGLISPTRGGRAFATTIKRPESPAATLFNGLEERWKRLKEQNWRQNHQTPPSNDTGGRQSLFSQHQQREEPRGILRQQRDASQDRRPNRRVVWDDNHQVWNIGGSRGGSPAPGAGAASGEAPAHVRAFDDAVDGPLSSWSAAAKKIGGDVEKVTDDARAIFSALRTFLWMAAGRSEPDQATFGSMLAPISKQIDALQSWRASQRNTPFFNHLSAVAEGIPAVGWVTVKPTPAPYVKEMLDAAMFYVNRVLKDNKVHSDWMNSWKETLQALSTFVRQTHTTGLVWNSAPGATAPGGGAPAAGSGPRVGGPGGPPPPPPPPPVEFLASAGGLGAGSGGDKAGRDALFAELNKGEAITSGLKKVTADMQTHKNPTLRGGAVVSAVGAAGKGPGGAAAAAQPAKPPRTVLENGKQWTVEFHKNNREIVVEVSDKKQTVYVYKCENCVVVVKGKVNSITLDSCKKTDIVFDALVSQCETINCQSVKIQTLGEMPTLSIQKTDGCQVYLSEPARNAEIITSKSSEMNVLIPGKDGEFVEFPVPEQFKTVFQGGKLVTVASDII